MYSANMAGEYLFIKEIVRLLLLKTASCIMFIKGLNNLNLSADTYWKISVKD